MSARARRTPRDDGALSVPPRYIAFAVACAAWLGAMSRWPEWASLQGAGRAWFANWAVQFVVVIAFWARPFTLPAWRSQPVAAGAAAWLGRMPGVDRYARVLRVFSPLPFDRRSPRALEAALGAAETTHTVTFTVVLWLMLIAAASGALTMAAFLGLWNVLFNLYPIAVQRQNRLRLQRLTRRRTVPVDPSAALRQG